MPRFYADTERRRLTPSEVDALVDRNFRGGIDDFNKWVRRVTSETLPAWTAGKSRKLFIQVGDGLIDGTPVGDASYWLAPPPKGYTGGRARGSWHPSLDNPKSEDIELDKTGNASKEAGEAIADAFEIGQSAFWTSNVPYILRLAHGWSRQAPNGWVPRALRQISNQFRV